MIKAIEQLFCHRQNVPVMERAKKCLEAVRKDGKGLTNRLAEYKLTHEELNLYCCTLPRMEIKVPKCILCGGDWYGLGKHITNDPYYGKPFASHDGLVKWVDFIQTFCVCTDYNQDAIDYNQDSDSYSFSRELYYDCLGNGSFIELVWREGSCHHPKKNALVYHQYLPRDNWNYIVLKTFEPDSQFITSSREEVWEVASKLMILL